jgi:YHS domain-containing protein
LKTLILCILGFWSFALFGKETPNVNKAGVMLEGYDPVSYFKADKPIKGAESIQAKQGNVTYWFSSEQNKTEFLTNPKKYEPQFQGWCAYAVADSKSKVEVDPLSYLIQDGRLLLFYNGIWGDTRSKWSKTKGKDPKAYLLEADKNWLEVKDKDP